MSAGYPYHCLSDAATTITQVDGPEYETVGAFGPLCMNFDIDSIVMANHLRNPHGMDIISAGLSIVFAMQLYKKNILRDCKKITWPFLFIYGIMIKWKR